MDIKSIALVMHAARPCGPELELAARLARRNDAFVTGLCAFEEPEMELSDCYAIGPDATGEVLTHRAERVRAAVGPVEAAFEASLEGVGRRWSLIDPDEAPQVSALRVRCMDLVIAPTPGRRRRPEIALAEALVQSAGVPCLIAPTSPPPTDFGRVLIAWDGSAPARRAVGAALGFLKAASAVQIATAGPWPWPGERSAPAALVSYLARHGIEASVVQDLHPRGSRAEFIHDRCVAFGAELLVMGAFGHARTSEDLFGGTTRTVLLEGALPVLMAH